MSPTTEIEEQEQHDSVNSGPIVVPAHVRIRVCACVCVCVCACWCYFVCSVRCVRTVLGP